MSARSLILISSVTTIALLTAGCGSSTGSPSPTTSSSSASPGPVPSNAVSASGASAPWTPPAGATAACQFEPGILAAILGVGTDVSTQDWSGATSDVTYLQDWITQAQGLSGSATVMTELQTLKTDAATLSTSIASSDTSGAESTYRQLDGLVPAFIEDCA